MKCLVTRQIWVLELLKFVAYGNGLHGGERGGDIVELERFDTYKRGLIQDIPTSLPPQPIGEATKASNLRRIPPRVQGRSHFTYFLYLIVQIRILYRDHLSPDPPLDAKTNPYFQASLSPIHPEITKTPSKHTKENEVIKEQEQSDQGLAQIDQLRRQEHEVSECKMVNTSKNDAHHKEAIKIERISSLPMKPNPRSLTIPCSVDIYNINAIADLGASVNIMSESLLEELSLANLKNANITVKMADKTKYVSQETIENILVKIDKFSFTSDFLIINTKGLNNKTIILGRPFLANIHAEMNISTGEVSLGIKEDRVKIKMNKHGCDFTTSVSKHLNERPMAQETQTDIYDTDLNESCSQDNPSQDEQKWEGLSCANWVKARYGKEDPEKCRETKERAIIGAIINKLPEEWFSKVSIDKDDLEVIIDYLEPTLYDGFIDHNDKAYKSRRNKLLGMPYIEPPPIIKEEVEITRYNLGAGEVFTKTKILNIKEFPRTAPDIADVRAEIINNKNGSSEDLSNTKRRHWCKPIYQWKEDICTKWASCNPHFDECDGGDNPMENKEY
ncbi:zinc knuckle CX2CX4HX4C containing protein [Tanacetum coccineum]